MFSIGLGKHIWPSACEVINACVREKQELEIKCIDNIDPNMLRSFLQETPESSFSKSDCTDVKLLFNLSLSAATFFFLWNDVAEKHGAP